MSTSLSFSSSDDILSLLPVVLCELQDEVSPRLLLETSLSFWAKLVELTVSYDIW